MRGKVKLRLDQGGMASILVTMILMIVVSLIVVGFGELSRRNQRQTLDRQLSSQAFYAAESAVNDVQSIVKSTLTNNPSATIPSKTSCGATSNGSIWDSLPSSTLNNNNGGVSYTCVLVDPAPNQLNYTLHQSGSTVIPIVQPSQPITTLTLAWDEANSSGLLGCPTSSSILSSSPTEFTPTTSWNCGFPVIRFDLVDFSGSRNQSGLFNDTMTMFAVPTSTAGVNANYSFTPGSGGDIRPALCGTSGGSSTVQCSVTITNLSRSTYYLHVEPIYYDTSLTLTDHFGSFSDAELQIDSTGKANDVLRRIQVYVPEQNGVPGLVYPSDAIQTTNSVCKQFSVYPNGYTNNQAQCVNNPQ